MTVPFRCPTDEQYVYGGEKCEEKAEKLKMSSDKIIAIAAGLGGGLVFVLTVALVVTCFRRRRRGHGHKLHEDDAKSEYVTCTSLMK